MTETTLHSLKIDFPAHLAFPRSDTVDRCLQNRLQRTAYQTPEIIPLKPEISFAVTFVLIVPIRDVLRDIIRDILVDRVADFFFGVVRRISGNLLRYFREETGFPLPLELEMQRTVRRQDLRHPRSDVAPEELRR